jgi:hypothetical protein
MSVVIGVKGKAGLCRRFMNGKHVILLEINKWSAIQIVIQMTLVINCWNTGEFDGD